MGTFTFYYKKANKEFQCELWNTNKETVTAALSKITIFLLDEIYSYLEEKNIKEIDNKIKKLKKLEDIGKVKPSEIYSEKLSQKTWYENYFVIRTIKKFGYLQYPKIDKKVNCQKTDFNDERIVIICDTDFWTIVKKHKFKKEEPVIPMYAISSIMNSIDNKLFEFLSEKCPFPKIKLRRTFKTLAEELNLVPKEPVIREIYVNAILKESYQPFITPEMIYKGVPKDMQALLKPPKSRGRKRD